MPITATAQQILVDLAERMTPWPVVEEALADALPGSSVYLGGDGLRPYACWTTEETATFSGVRVDGTPDPPLIRDVFAGRYGLPRVDRDPVDERVYTAVLPSSEPLRRRLDVPRLLLVGLGDTDRYRGARLPLGVARLGQWLRFAHCARVDVVDYSVTEHALETVTQRLRDERFDIVGVSVNFGQWEMLHELAAVVNRAAPRIVVLGNILAAFSAERAIELFDAARDGAAFVATGVGERPLELLCRQHRDPAAWAGIDGLIRSGAGTPKPRAADRVVGPPDLVYPDDALVLEIADRGGQISLETSFGCQFGACTFCPRDHRGDGWTRGHTSTVVAALERAATTGAVVSLVDEEFFGAEGLIDPPMPDLPAALIMATCRRLGVSYEIYTRLEQLFDRRRSTEWNIERARVLVETAFMRRIFVGVESGSPGQLRRYGKGQTVAQTVDSLRIGSALGVPMEFGFITFDPLLHPSELAENINFLGRDDVIAARTTGTSQARIDAVADYLEGGALVPSGVPLYQHVAYMATELEVLGHSRYADHLQRRHPDLLDGTYDSNFARYGVRYREPAIADVAGWSRVWTEGMFTPVYEARMTARAAGRGAATAATDLVARYRDATFTLLVRLTLRFLPELAADLHPHLVLAERDAPGTPEQWLTELSRQTLPDRPPAEFDTRLRSVRRDR